MRKSVLLVLLAMLCSCAKQQNAARKEGQGGSGSGVASAASQAQPGSGKILGNDHAPALFAVKVDGKFGYIDKSGKIVIKPQFYGGSRFAEGLAAVQTEKVGRVGYIDETGTLVIPLQFDLADPFSEGMAAFMKDSQWGFVDRTGQIVIQPKYGAVSRFSQGLAVAGTVQGPQVAYTFINPKGEAQTDNHFETAVPFGEGLAPVRSLGQMVRFVDTSFKTVINPQFMAAGEFADGVAPVQMRVPDGMRWGFVGKDGKMAIPAHYYDAYPFRDGLAGVKLPTGKWGFINKKDALVIPAKYDAVQPFDQGLAQVHLGDSFGYIDATGKVVWEPKK